MRRASELAVVSGLSGLLLFAVAPIGCRASEGTPATISRQLPASPAANRRALIVAIAKYAPKTGWRTISSDRDVPLVRTALLGQGFSEIDVLTDQHATRGGILEAFRKTLLEPARPGDLAVFYYSGHGQQITDDGHDEPDGYDEALVPYDAPMRETEGYNGERHLRDDELHRSIWQLRRKIGPGGQVVVFLDTCFSGTPRGASDTVRGGPPLGPAAGGRSAMEDGGGFFEELVSRGERVAEAGETELAPFVVFSAARHNEQAKETPDDDGYPVGSLTYAVTREFARLPPSAALVEPGDNRAWTYRRFHERIRWVMSGRVSNQPQVEGDIDSLVFGKGLVVPEPYVKVTKIRDDGLLELAAGSLAGLLEETRIEVHREGALRPTSESLLASGTIVHSATTWALVELEGAGASKRRKGVDLLEVRQGRAFVTHHAFGNLHLTVELSALEPAFAARLTRLLTERVGAVELVEKRGDVVVSLVAVGDSREARVQVETSVGRIPLLAPTSLAIPGLEQRIGRLLLDYARNLYFRKLQLEDSGYRVDLEIIPVRGIGCQGEPVDYTTCAGFEDLDPAKPPGWAANRVWQPGDLYRLRAVHRGRHPAYLNVLDLQPDGVIRSFWPQPGTGDLTALVPGDPWNLPACFEVTEPAGTEVLLLIASDQPIDLRPFVTREGVSLPGEARGGGPGPFVPLLGDTTQARSKRITSSGVHTSAVILTVVPQVASPAAVAPAEVALSGRRP